MEKSCLHCNTAFMAKRSDAVYCSTACRNSANYSKKSAEQRQANNSLTTVDEDTPQVKLGKAEREKYSAIVDALSDKISECITQREAMVMRNEDFLIEISTIETSKLEIHKKHISPIEVVLRMPYSEIYNRYLNGAYLNSYQNGDKYAYYFLKNEQEFYPDFEGDKTAVNMVVKYLKQLNESIKEFEERIVDCDKEIALLNRRIDNTNSEIKSIKEDLRYQEARLSRYDNLILCAEHLND